MPSLADLTDYDPMANATGVIPEADGVRRVYINSPGIENKPANAGIVESIANKLLGLNGQERYQLWPEKVVREGLSAAGDALAGKTPQWQVDPVSGDVHTSPQMVEGAQAMSALAGTGGLGGVTDATLGATPFLRPALKYKDRLYKGKEGQGHTDVIPDALYPEFQKAAMAGDDISKFNFGFHNDKGQFLDREKALEYGINTGIIDPAAGKFGALTSTMMADSSKPGTAIEATAKTFYSALEHNVGKIAQDKMTGDQWLGTLANKPGVKPEELQWSGLKEYLEQNKGKPVTKEEIQQHLNENKTELGEVVKGTKDTYLEQYKVIRQDGHIDSTYSNAEGAAKRAEAIKGSVKEQHETKPMDDTKYSQYQVPGGSNYREMLMTLPKKSEESLKGWDKITADSQNYKSSHWDEPNILAHMRMNDLTIDGKKSLHLEEVQSDWHQDGRKRGYVDNDKPYEIFDPTNGKVIDRFSTKEEARLAVNDPKYGDKYLDYSKSEGVPDAPFKKNWHELALKRAIREAAENGYDRLSWTAGEHHPTNPKNLNQKGEAADAADKGMQGFYNNMLPKSAEKLTGQKVKTTNLPPKQKLSIEKDVGEDYVIMDDANRVYGNYSSQAKAQEWLDAHNPSAKVHYIDLPQSVKDTAIGKGFPLYSSSHMFTPIAGNPFSQDQK